MICPRAAEEISHTILPLSYWLRQLVTTGSADQRILLGVCGPMGRRSSVASQLACCLNALKYVLTHIIDVSEVCDAATGGRHTQCFKCNCLAKYILQLPCRKLNNGTLSCSADPQFAVHIPTDSYGLQSPKFSVVDVINDMRSLQQRKVCQRNA